MLFFDAYRSRGRDSAETDFPTSQTNASPASECDGFSVLPVLADQPNRQVKSRGGRTPARCHTRCTRRCSIRVDGLPRFHGRGRGLADQSQLDISSGDIGGLRHGSVKWSRLFSELVQECPTGIDRRFAGTGAGLIEVRDQGKAVPKEQPGESQSKSLRAG